MSSVPQGPSNDASSTHATRPVAWVTGSSSGIGRAIALELARHGFDLIVHGYHNRIGGEATAEQAAKLGAETHLVLADLSRAATRLEAVEAACQWRGTPQVLINNAGADVLTGEAASWTFERKLKVLWETDVHATLYLSRQIGKRLVAERHEPRFSGTSPSALGDPAACIINVGWDQAEFGMEGDSGEMFATIKGAIMSFTRSLARSLAPHVRVNCVAPGWIRTDWGESTEGYWDQRARQEAMLRRWGTPEDVATAVRYLCSPASQFITGHILPVNGGFIGNWRGERE